MKAKAKNVLTCPKYSVWSLLCNLYENVHTQTQTHQVDLNWPIKPGGFFFLLLFCFFIKKSFLLGGLKPSQRNTAQLTHQQSGLDRRWHKSSRHLKASEEDIFCRVMNQSMLMSGLFRKYRRLPCTTFMLEAVTDDSHICWLSAEKQCGCRSLKSYKGVVCQGIQRFVTVDRWCSRKS